MTARDATRLQARLCRALLALRHARGYDDARALAMGFALGLLHDVCASRPALRTQAYTRALDAAEACVRSGFATSAVAAAERAALPLLSGRAGEREAYAGLAVRDPPRAAQAAFRLALGHGLWRRAAERLRALEAEARAPRKPRRKVWRGRGGAPCGSPF